MSHETKNQFFFFKSFVFGSNHHLFMTTGNIFKYGNRNAASHLWSSFLLDRSWNFDTDTMHLMFSSYCAVSGSPVRSCSYHILILVMFISRTHSVRVHIISCTHFDYNITHSFRSCSYNITHSFRSFYVNPLETGTSDGLQSISIETRVCR